MTCGLISSISVIRAHSVQDVQDIQCFYHEEFHGTTERGDVALELAAAWSTIRAEFGAKPREKECAIQQPLIFMR